MYSIVTRKHVDKTFSKLAKKKSKQLKIIQKKLMGVIRDPYRFKSLKKPLQNMRRVHINKSFVLVFSINEKNKEVILENYDHHDNVYKKRVH